MHKKNNNNRVWIKEEWLQHIARAAKITVDGSQNLVCPIKSAIANTRKPVLYQSNKKKLYS
jgi:hypothetical protein